MQVNGMEHCVLRLGEVSVSNVDELMGLNYWLGMDINCNPCSRKLPSRVPAKCEVNKNVLLCSSTDRRTRQN